MLVATCAGIKALAENLRQQHAGWVLRAAFIGVGCNLRWD
jgi:hypothetical protein